MITIYYDPDDPASSVVERVSPSAWFVVGNSVGAILSISIGLFIIVQTIENPSYFRVRREPQRAPNNRKPVMQQIKVERTSVQSILGVWDPNESFDYALTLGGFNGKRYLEVMRR